MTNILNFCRLNDIRVVLIKQAYFIDPIYQKNLKLLSNDEILDKLLVYHKETSRDKKSLFWIYTNLILNNILDEMKLNNPDLIVVDPTDKLYSFEKDKFFYKDGIHLTSQGNAVIAEEILKSIKNIIKM